MSLRDAILNFVYPPVDVGVVQLTSGVSEEDSFKEVKDETFALNDGTVVSRAYASDILEKKRLESLNKLGSKWLNHPANRIKKGAVAEESIVTLKRQDYFLTTHLNFVRYASTIA